MLCRRLIPLVLLLAPLNVAAQSTPVSPEVRRAVVDSLAQNLIAGYVFPELALKMAGDLRARLGQGEYDSLDSDNLARRLTRDLYAIAHDGHLRVLSRRVDGSAGGGGVAADREAWLRSINYGFERVEILPGNVGLVEIRGFLDVGQAREAALEVMRKLAKVDALIVDLRRNGGGEPETVALVSTFLFPRGQRVHLNDLHWRAGDRIEEFYTDPDLDVARFSGPVYVLTSRRTFSAAEEFTYNLKQLKRATQVGETTGGGANPGDFVSLVPGFVVFVPTGRAVNPISHDNWEGKGVVPEVATPADSALDVARRLAQSALGRAGT